MINEKEREIYLTQEGLDKVKEELRILKLEKRPEVIQAIKEARALGDLSENADYHAARDEQAVLEARIKDLEEMVDEAIIIKEAKTNYVGIGNTVTIQYVEDDEEEEYKMVGSHEADPFENKISNESPIGMAIMKHKKGDIVKVSTPDGGTYEIKIIEIK